MTPLSVLGGARAPFHEQRAGERDDGRACAWARRKVERHERVQPLKTLGDDGRGSGPLVEQPVEGLVQRFAFRRPRG